MRIWRLLRHQETDPDDLPKGQPLFDEYCQQRVPEPAKQMRVVKVLKRKRHSESGVKKQHYFISLFIGDEEE
jgi:hypothetical protein